eukprot:SAG31_NODE_8017_length_1540_cov_1.092991_1_plen_446_part_10
MCDGRGTCGRARILDQAEVGTIAQQATKLLASDAADRNGAEPSLRLESSFPFDEHSAAALNSLALSPALLKAASNVLAIGHHDVRLVEAVLCGHSEPKPVTHEDSHFATPAQFGEAAVAIIPLALGDASLPADGHAYFIGLGAPFQTSCPLSFRVTLRASFAEWVSADAYVRSAPVRLAQFPIQLSALGFPHPGHVHWTPESLADVARRYPDVDLSEYSAALRSSAKADSAAQVAKLPEREGGSFDESGRYWMPIERAQGTDPLHAPLSARQVAEFREQGCILIDGIWPRNLISAAVKAAENCDPGCEQAVNKSPHYTRNDSTVLHDATHAYPFNSPALNDVTLHPGFLAAVAQLLRVDVSAIRLTQSALDEKRRMAPPDPNEKQNYSWAHQDGNQPMHQDFGNNTLLTPARSKSQWADPNDVQAILYYSTWHTGGPTAFVPGLNH